MNEPLMEETGTDGAAVEQTPAATDRILIEYVGDRWMLTIVRGEELRYSARTRSLGEAIGALINWKQGIIIV